MGQILRLVVVMNLLVSGGVVTTPAISNQFGPNTVTLDVSPAQQMPGGYVNVTVNMATSLDDVREVLEVYLPDELTVVGEVMCSGACSSAGTIPGTNQVSAVFNVGGYEPRPNRFATLTFSAVISSDATPGSSVVISAFLGSPQVSDQATVTILEPPEQSIYFDVSPEGAIVAEDGVFTVLIRSYVPYLRGSGLPPVTELPEQQLTVRLPPGLELDETSGCAVFRLPPSEPSNTCSVSTSIDDGDRTIVSISVPGEEDGIGLLLTVRNVGITPGEHANLILELDEPSGEVGIANPVQVLEVFAVDSLAGLGADFENDSLSILLISNNYGCTSSSTGDGTKLGLGEWGGGPVLSTASISVEAEAKLSEMVGTRCPRVVSFPSVDPMPLYILGTSPDPLIGFCNACVLGTVPWADNAVPIITDEPFN